MSTSPKRFSLAEDIRRLSLTEFLWLEVARRLLQTIYSYSSAGWESTTTRGMSRGLLSFSSALIGNRTFWFNTPAPLCLTSLYFARGIRADILNPFLVFCPLLIFSVHCSLFTFSILILLIVYPHKSLVFPIRYIYPCGRHKDIVGGVYSDLVSLILGSRRRWVICFTPRPVCSLEKVPWYPVTWMLGGSQSRLWRCGVETNFLPLLRT
jgi:hypothetical protein